MKGFFKSIALLFASLLTITACDSFMPVTRRSSREKSSSSEVLMSVPDTVHISCTNGNAIAINVGETFSTVYALYDEVSGTNLRLEDGSEARSFGSSLQVESDCFFNYLNVTLQCDTPGEYSYEVKLVASDGYVVSDTFSVMVEPISEYCAVRMNVPSRFIPGREYSASFSIYNPANDGYLRLKDTSPYRVERQGQGLRIKRFQLDNPYTVVLVFVASNNPVSDIFGLSIQSRTGGLYKTEFEYTILPAEHPMYHFYIEPDPLIVDDGGSGEVVIYLQDENNNNVEFDTTYFYINPCDRNFSYELVEFNNYFVKLRATNLIRRTKGQYDLFLRDFQGYDCNCRLDVFTETYFNEVYELRLAFFEIDTGERLIAIEVLTMTQDYETIASIYISSRYNRISPFTIDGLDVTRYDYFLNAHPSGRDLLEVRVLTASGNQYVGTIEITL